MSPVFVPQAKSGEYTDFANKKFSDAVTAAAKFVPGISWKQLALYNWGTDVPAEVNRALEETVGLKVVDPADPKNSQFDTGRGPGGACKILLPKIWASDPLDENTVQRISVKKRRPVPAVSIKSLTCWFIPKDDSCQLKYSLEGATATADKVDCEVFPTRYVQENKGGELVAATPHTDKDKEYIFQKEKVFEEKTPDTKLKPPATDRDFNAWKGESQATQGLLKHAGGGTYLSYACAPYTVQLRYFKAEGDNKARILLDPFCPYWKLPATSGASEVLEDKSLVVTWKIKGDNDKLKIGQLIIWDKKEAPVFKAVLNEENLRKGKYNLLKGPPRIWEKTNVKKSDMPYRVQIQAHSIGSEENGLAIAVMHTAVKPFVYDKVQLIGFNIKPDVTQSLPQKYLGDPDDSVDLEKRCEIMKTAIKAAHGHGEIQPGENILKVFMAPEFFFRGAQGGYPMHERAGDPGLVPGIIGSLREETNQFKYADWLFIFGTAIGYLPHADGNKKITYSGDAKHNALIMETGGKTVTLIRVQTLLAQKLNASIKLGVKWKVVQDALSDEVTACQREDFDKCWLTLKGKKAFKANKAIVLLEPIAWVLTSTVGATNTVIKVKSRICARMPLTITPLKSPWCVKQGGGEIEIEKCEHDSSDPDDIYTLTLKTNPSINKDACIELLEPISTEVFNLALVQKGWPVALPTEKNLRSAVIYKENVSSIDFLGSHFATFSSAAGEWYDPTGAGREINIHGDDVRLVIPTAGSEDLLGDKGRPFSGRRTWEDAKGIMHTVGSEINTSGEGGGSVITIDGVTLGIEVCLDHMCSRLDDFYQNRAATGDPQVQVQLIPSWGMSIGGGPISCLPDGLILNVDGQRSNSIARINNGHYSCDHHPDEDNGTVPANCTQCHKTIHLFGCSVCAQAFYTDAGATECIATPSHTPIERLYKCTTCGKLFKMPLPLDGKCPEASCKATTLEDHWDEDKALQPIGSKIATTGSVATVTATSMTTFYKQDGAVIVFESKALPKAKTV